VIRFSPVRVTGDSGDNPSPRLLRARNHRPSKVAIIAVEKMIPSAVRASYWCSGAASHEVPRSQPA